MQNWLNDIPQLLNYFVPGYFAVVIFNFVTYSKEIKRQEVFITNSIVISFILNAITNSIGNYVQCIAKHKLIALLVEAVIFGLCVGFLWKKEKIQNQIEFIFGRNFADNPFIETWRTIDDNQIWQVTVQLNGTPYIFVGQLTAVYDPYGDSVLELSYYQKYDGEGNLIADGTCSDNQKLFFGQDKILYLDQRIIDKERAYDSLV